MSAFPYKHVVDIAATSKDLTVVDTVEARLGVTFTSPESDLVETLIHEQSARLAAHCGRELAEEKRTDHFRTGSDAGDSLWLSHWPVTTVHAVVENGVTLTAADYEINLKSGQVWRLDGDDGRRCWASGVKITIQHTSGFEMLPDLPSDAEWACIALVLREWHGRARDPALRSFEVPDVYKESVSVPGGDSFGKSGLPIDVERAMDPYRLPVFA